MSTTRYVKVESESELPDLGVDIHLQIVDNKVEALQVGNGDNLIRVVGEHYGDGLKVLKLESGEEVTKYQVAGDLLGLSYYSSDPFDEIYQAENHRIKLCNDKGISVEESGLEVVPVEVIIYNEKI